MPDLTPAQKAALKVARAGDFDRLKELLEGQDVIKDSNQLSSAIREKRLPRDDNHDRISLECLFMAAAGIGHAEMLRYLLGLYPYTGPSIPTGLFTTPSTAVQPRLCKCYWTSTRPSP